jgi:phage repressor protein C with HTH and peptisase S24 domain
MPAQPLTSEQRADAARLKHLFATWQKGRREAQLPSSQEAVSDLLGFNQSAVSQYLSGRIPLNVDAATKFASLLNCSIADFSPGLAAQAGRYSSVATTNDPAFGDTPFIEDTRPVRAGEATNAVAIPRVKLRLRAGVAQFDTEPDMDGDGHELVRRDVLERLGLNPENLLAVRVRGPSMEPMMFEDDVIIIDKSDRKPISRELYAVNFNGEPLIKQLIKQGNEWHLHSINPDHGPVNVKSGQCSIVGRVVIQPTRVLTGRL